MSDRPLIVMAGGGTGGHLFPALAVAEALGQQNQDVDVLLLATDRKFDRTVLPDGPVAWRGQPVRPFPVGVWHWPGFLVAWWRSVRQVEKLFASRRPAAVLGTGGYGAGPAVHVAARLKIPIGILNPDALPGRANRHLAGKATAVFAQWPETTERFASGIDVRVTGCPVRSAFRTARRQEGLAAFGLDPARRTLLITGASQGARTINRAIVQLLEQLAGRDDWQVLHLSGEVDYEEVRAAYEAEHPTAKVLPFTEQMPEAVAASDLVVCRAGAGTLAELACVGRASLLLPYPFGRDRHQQANAEMMAKAGAARVMRDLIDPTRNAAQLGLALQELMSSPERLGQMAAAAKSLGRPDAAGQVAAELLSLAGLKGAGAGGG